MLLPTQQSASLVVTSLVQSVVDDIEKRRVEEEEKLRGKKEDKVLKARIKSDDVAQAANAKINAHFFGALKRDENPMAVLAARFIAVMGLTEGAGETSSDFGTRLEDALAFTDLVTKKDADGNPMKIGLATFKVSVVDLNAAVDGSDEHPSAMAALLARFVTQNGLQQVDGEDDTDYKSRLGAELTKARAGLPTTVANVETRTGLRDLGITAKEMIEAIKHPHGDTAQKIKGILDDKAVEDKTSTTETAKILQRLEEVAKPKTIEELKLDRTKKDPTKVEDAETRQEREEQILALEAGGKLEDVKKIQEAVKDRHDAAAESDEDPQDGTSEDALSIGAVETIQVLAAGAEAAKAETGTQAQDTSAETMTQSADKESSGETAAPSDEEQAIMLARAGQPTADDAQKDILAIHVDENGIYDMLARKKAA